MKKMWDWRKWYHGIEIHLVSLSLPLLSQVWANIQEYDDPSQVSFDFSNSKQWRPLFSPTPAQPLASVQQELHYSETDLAKVQELQDR